MKIKQFEDKHLAQYSCEKKIILVDPARDTNPYPVYKKQKDEAFGSVPVLDLGENIKKIMK